MLNKLIKNVVDNILGNRIIRKTLLVIFGYRWNGWMLSLFGYRPIHMVARGETCVLAGIYNADTIIGFSSIVGGLGEVIVIEANPQNAERLTNETKHLSNVVLTNKAVWNAKGEMEFICSQSSKDQAFNRLASEELQEFPLHIDASPLKVMVETSSIPDILKELNIHKVDHINLTINGAELQALEGLSELRRNNPDVRAYINSETPDPALKVIDGLKECGFKVFTSHMIRVVNTKIKLVRIYACN